MDRLPRDYERQIAKKRLPGLLGAIATAENRAVTLPEEKGRAEAVRARSLRAVVAQLLADLGEDEPLSPPPTPSRRRASAGVAQAPPVAAAPSAPGPAPMSPATTTPPALESAPAPPATAPPPAEPDPAPAPAPPSPPAVAAAPALAPTPAAPLPQQAPTRTQEAGPQKLRRSTP